MLDEDFLKRRVIAATEHAKAAARSAAAARAQQQRRPSLADLGQLRRDAMNWPSMVGMANLQHVESAIFFSGIARQVSSPVTTVRLAPACPPRSRGATEPLGSLSGAPSQPRGRSQGLHFAAFNDQANIDDSPTNKGSPRWERAWAT